MRILTKKRFTSWLEEFPPTHVVGTAGKSGFCPIANFLSSCGLKDVTVGPFHYNHRRVSKADMLVPLLPIWAQIFVRKVDAGWWSTHPDITAGEALGMLKG